MTHCEPVITADCFLFCLFVCFFLKNTSTLVRNFYEQLMLSLIYQASSKKDTDSDAETYQIENWIADFVFAGHAPTLTIYAYAYLRDF